MKKEMHFDVLEVPRDTRKQKQAVKITVWVEIFYVVY